MITLAELIQSLACLQAVRVTEAELRRPVASVTADSRAVLPGSLFVALRGEKADGRSYIADAVARGCLAVVRDDDGGGEATVPTILVEDAQAAIGALAAAWYGHPADQLQLIGITGTNGKTTCSYLIESMLLAAGFWPGVIGTINYRCQGPEGPQILEAAPLTTPDPVSLQRLLRTMVDRQVTHLVMEVSSHALQQQRLGQICFDVVLFTNLSRDHLDYHRGMDEYFAAKQRLFLRHLKPEGRAVVVDHPPASGPDWGEMLARSLPVDRVIRCGLTPPCAVRAANWSQTLEGIRCSLRLRGEEAVFSSALTGGFNLLNILAAAGVGLGLGLAASTIRQGLAGIGRVPGRLERVSLPGTLGTVGPAVFVDYAHTPDALENVLQTLKELAPRRLICVFGCGGDRDRGKRPLMGAIAGQYASAVIVTSDNPRSEAPESIIAAIVEGLAASGLACGGIDELFAVDRPLDGYAVIADRARAIATACSLARAGDTVVVAGKGHEDYQIIGATKNFFDDRLAVANGLLCWNQGHLLAATGGRVVAGRQHGLLAQVSTDSRHIGAGDIFLALSGETFDGHAYIEAAVAGGAAVVIAERMPAPLAPGVLFLQVDDTLTALGQLAGYRRRLLAPQVKVAAITGSSGKTTVKEMTAAIFAQGLQATHTGIDPLLKTRGNFNNLVGLPLSLLPLAAGHRLAILEMGMNAPGEIARLTAIADPDIGCINTVHPAHLLGLGSIEGVARAKGELFAGMRPEAIRVVNCDDPLILALASKAGGPQVGFAVTATGRRHAPWVRVTRQLNLGEQGMRFTLHIGPWQDRITVPVHGSHNVANCAAAAAIAHAAGIEPATIVRGLQGYVAVDKRLVLSTLPGDLRLVNDAYNANPASMAAGLRAVAAFGPNRRHLAALGDMLELGPAAEALHRQIGTLVAELGYDRLAVTGAQAEIVAKAARAAGMTAAQVRTFPDPMAMADWIVELLAEGSLASSDWLLVKGSRGMRMERLIAELELRLQTPH